MATQITTKGILTINGTQVEKTFNNLRRATRLLEADLRKLPEGTEEFTKKKQELEQVRKQFHALSADIRGTTQAAKEFNNDIRSTNDIVDRFAGKFTESLQRVAGGEVTFTSLGAVIKFFATEAKLALSSIPIVGWIAALVGAIGLGVREVYQFNNKLLEANKLTSQITKLQGESLDSLTVRSQTLEDILKLDRKETLEAARNLVQNFGITYEEAMNQIGRGAIAGGAANNEFLDSIKEYPTFFAAAGYSAQEFINLINAGYDLGVYNDKLPDALKEFDLSMREQTKSTREALVNAFGAPFADDLLDRVSKGKTTVKESLIEIAQESKKYHLSEKQQAQITADVFRGAGEDVGGFAKVIDIVTLAVINQGGALSEHEQAVKDQISNYNDLGEAKIDALKSDSFYAFKRDIENIWIGIKKIWYQFIIELRANLTFIQAAYTTVVEGVSSIPTVFSKAFNLIKSNLGQLGLAILEAGSMMKQAFQLDFDGAMASFDRLKSHLGKAITNTKSMVNDLSDSISKSFSQNVSNILKEDAAKAAAQRILETQRNAGQPANNFDGTSSKGSTTKSTDDARAKQEEIERSEREAYKKRMQALFEFEAEKAQAIEDAFQREVQIEMVRRNKEEFQAKQQILDAENEKLKASSLKAKGDLQKQIDILHNIELLNEQTHHNKLRAIQQKQDAIIFESSISSEQKRIDEERRIDEESIIELANMKDAKLALSKMQHLQLTDQELAGIKSLEDAKRALREEADRKMLHSQLEALTEHKTMLEKALNTLPEGKEREKLASDLDALAFKITAVKGAINNGEIEDEQRRVLENEQKRGSVDLLGFSVAQWETMFKNLDTTEGKINGALMTMNALGSAAKMFGDLQKELAEREMARFEKQQQKRKTELEKNLKLGYINNEEYNIQLQKMEAETANKKAEISYKTAKAQKAANLMSAIAGTATAVVGALGNKPWTPLNFALAGMVGALGAVQVGMIASQPLPEQPSFAKGGFTGLGSGSPDSTGLRPIGIAHEKEWYAPPWMLEEPRTAQVINWLEAVRRSGPHHIDSFASGGYTSERSVAPAPQSVNTSTVTKETNSDELQFFLQRNVEFLEILIEKGVHLESSMENMRKIDKGLKGWHQLTNKNKY